MDYENQTLAEVRDRARRNVHWTFALIALAALAAALAAHHAPDALMLPPEESDGIAKGFLFLGTAYVLTLYVWDWLFGAYYGGE